jgi:hypothetical protein
VRLQHPTLTVCSFSVPCLLFSFFFARRGFILSRGLCWFIAGVAGGVPCDAYLLTCWSASPKQVWRWCLVSWEPSCFLSVTWCGEALYQLGVQGVKVWFFLVLYFHQVWLQCFCKIFDLHSLRCLLLHSSHHLVSSSVEHFSPQKFYEK